jgi:hypothetical protein
MGGERKLVKGAHNKARTRRHFPSSPISPPPPPQHQLPFPFINRKQRAAVAAPDYLLIGLRALKMNGCFSAAAREWRESALRRRPSKHHQTFTAKEHCVFRVLINFQFARRQPQRRACLFWTPNDLCGESSERLN